MCDRTGAGDAVSYLLTLDLTLTLTVLGRKAVGIELHYKLDCPHTEGSMSVFVWCRDHQAFCCGLMAILQMVLA